MKKSNTTNTAASADITVKGLLLIADKAESMSAEAYHELWELGKRNLSREDQALLWSELSSRSIERKLGHFAGRKYAAKHPEAAAPAKQEKPAAKKSAAKKSAPAKQEEPAAPAKQEKKPAPEKKPAAPAKQEKMPTQKEMLANILVTLASMDRRLTAIEKKLA